MISVKCVDRKEKIARLIAYLISRSESLHEFAKQIGVKHPTVIRWRDKLAAPTGNNLVGLASYLGCSVDYLSNYFDSPQTLEEFLAGIKKKIKKESPQLRTAKNLVQSLSWEDLLELNAYLSSFLLDSSGSLNFSAPTTSHNQGSDLQLSLPFVDLRKMIQFSYSERLCFRELLRHSATQQGYSLSEFIRLINSDAYREIADLINASPEDEDGIISVSSEALCPFISRVYKAIDWENYNPIFNQPLVPYRSLEELLQDLKDCEQINTF